MDRKQARRQMVPRQRLGGVNHSGRDGTEVGMGHTGASQPPASLHLWVGRGQPPHNIWPTPSPIQCWNPTELPQMTGCSLYPAVARQLNIFPNVMPLSASPSSITTRLLHNFCLQPQCTMSKHVVLGGRGVWGRGRACQLPRSVGTAGAMGARLAEVTPARSV